MNNFTIIPIFPSLLTLVECKNFCTIKQELIQWIGNYRKKDIGSKISNRGGWHSSFNILSGDETFKKYLNYIGDNVISPSKFEILNYWISVNPQGSFNLTHVHSNCDLSGVLWVQSDDKSGKIVFENLNDHSQWNYIDKIPENMSKDFNFYHNYELFPKEGMMCIFPSNLPHYVDINMSNYDRISIAFNIKLL